MSTSNERRIERIIAVIGKRFGEIQRREWAPDPKFADSRVYACILEREDPETHVKTVNACGEGRTVLEARLHAAEALVGALAQRVHLDKVALDAADGLLFQFASTEEGDD